METSPLLGSKPNLIGYLHYEARFSGEGLHNVMVSTKSNIVLRIASTIDTRTATVAKTGRDMLISASWFCVQAGSKPITASSQTPPGLVLSASLSGC